MKRHFQVAWIALILSFVAFESVASDIDVQIAPHSVLNQTSSSVVTVTVRNTGAGKVYIPKSLSPFYTPGNHLMTNLFKVNNASGKEVPFTGRMVRVAPRDPDTFFFVIAPGQSMSQDIDLSADYDLTATGTFQVSYVQSYATTVHTDDEGEIDSEFNYQSSVPVSVWISPPTTGVASHRGTSLQALATSSVQTSVTSDGQQ